jgi:hypothetical protein
LQEFKLKIINIESESLILEFINDCLEFKGKKVHEIMNNFLENQCMIVPEEKLSIFPELNFYLEKIFNIISSHKSDFTHITMVN